ncbi:translocator -like isoform X2 [Brachionus plicatilis]|uniref:Translocator-like isoform X2 n=1 Tax=Brachionus plicatilis TaxID=10195 RepID=A0A3M7RIH4_BRAPC|nr:translocator -like isoform X2 [Brachionus plicatilis]
MFFLISKYGVLPNLGGIVSIYFTRKNLKTWFESLDKPSWRPPSWAFGSVWTTLYTSMGYASYLIVKDGVGDSRKIALGLYGSQLALNWAWSPLFFICHKLGLSTVVSNVLVANIAACIYVFYPINKTAAYLLVPYLAWVSFATAINFSIWRRNIIKKCLDHQIYPGTTQVELEKLCFISSCNDDDEDVVLHYEGDDKEKSSDEDHEQNVDTDLLIDDDEDESENFNTKSLTFKENNEIISNDDETNDKLEESFEEIRQKIA